MLGLGQLNSGQEVERLRAHRPKQGAANMRKGRDEVWGRVRAAREGWAFGVRIELR